MRIKAEKLTNDEFAPYGTFFDPKEGYGEGEITFQPDRMLYYVGGRVGSICSIRMKYRAIEMTVTEYHDECEEVFGGFGCDVVFHVGLLGDDNKPIMNSIRVFRLPAGCFVRVKRRVLHHAGFVLAKDDTAYGLVVLSPSAYTIDCKVINFDAPIAVEL